MNTRILLIPIVLLALFISMECFAAGKGKWQYIGQNEFGSKYYFVAPDSLKTTPEGIRFNLWEKSTHGDQYQYWPKQKRDIKYFSATSAGVLECESGKIYIQAQLFYDMAGKELAHMTAETDGMTCSKGRRCLTYHYENSSISKLLSPKICKSRKH